MLVADMIWGFTPSIGSAKTMPQAQVLTDCIAQMLGAGLAVMICSSADCIKHEKVHMQALREMGGKADECTI
eukprot:scaffold141238_cov18-Prasinocladus_malaysianus.AAC.1